jgi:hypothetical protein
MSAGHYRRRPLLETSLLLMMAALALVTWHFLSPRSSPINSLLTGSTLPAVPRHQRPITLDPALFTGQAQEGYRIARERPALLESLPCYCGCYTNRGHQNLLDCFADRHAETCSTCLSMALAAQALEKRGYDIEDILALLNRKFAPGDEPSLTKE